MRWWNSHRSSPPTSGGEGARAPELRIPELGVALAVAGLVLEQIAFNVLRCEAPWQAQMRLVGTVLVPPLVFLLLRAPRAAFAAMAPQFIVIAWFNLVRCQIGDRAGESGFVAGLGVLSAIVFSFASAALLGLVGLALDLRARRRSRKGAAARADRVPS